MTLEQPGLGLDSPNGSGRERGATLKGMPKSVGKDTIFVVVDHLSKYAHFFAFSHPFTVVIEIKCLLENFGVNYLHYKAIIYSLVLHTILKPIVNQRSSIDVLKFFCATSLVHVHMTGQTS